jgi:hypothetical protein
VAAWQFEPFQLDGCCVKEIAILIKARAGQDKDPQILVESRLG